MFFSFKDEEHFAKSLIQQITPKHITVLLYS
jgi:hypothetical protein